MFVCNLLSLFFLTDSYYIAMSRQEMIAVAKCLANKRHTNNHTVAEIQLRILSKLGLFITVV